MLTTVIGAFPKPSFLKNMPTNNKIAIITETWTVFDKDESKLLII